MVITTRLSFLYIGCHPTARLCRIVIHPDVPAGTQAIDFKVKW